MTNTFEFDAASGRDEDLEQDLAQVGVSRPTEHDGSPYAALRGEIERDLTGVAITLDVPGRPDWAVRYRCDLQIDQLNRWRKRAADRTAPDGLDESKFGCMLLANQSEAIIYRGEDVPENPDDAASPPMSFRSRKFHELVGVGSSVDAVKAWYVRDGSISAAGQAVLFGSGFGEEASEADPTSTAS